MIPLLVIKPMTCSSEMEHMIGQALENTNHEISTEWSSEIVYNNRRVLFCLDLDETGHCIELIKYLRDLKVNSGDNALNGSICALFVRSNEDVYTKRASQELIGFVNQLGCRVIGHSVVEVVKGLKNFRTWQKTIDKSLEEIRDDLCKKQVKRLVDFKTDRVHNNKILVLHSSSHETSNTLMLWEKVQKHLNYDDIRVFHVENGSIVDCKGCDFKTCIHFSKQKSCFYGGVVMREILPAIEESDIIVWICPNYNDALSANLTALINRLTALYRRVNFYNKRIYSVVVSGNSGSDSVTNQLLGALNINKGFQLPPKFALTEIANDPGHILNVNDIDEKAKVFADYMNDEKA